LYPVHTFQELVTFSSCKQFSDSMRGSGWSPIQLQSRDVHGNPVMWPATSIVVSGFSGPEGHCLSLEDDYMQACVEGNENVKGKCAFIGITLPLGIQLSSPSLPEFHQPGVSASPALSHPALSHPDAPNHPAPEGATPRTKKDRSKYLRSGLQTAFDEQHNGLS
jgi:hypothetical protein